MPTQQGTTSACAENTSDGKTFPKIFWNYLRVRGEYLVHVHHVARDTELPPRARRIPLVFGFAYFEQGTTSACAENTHTTSRHTRS